MLLVRKFCFTDMKKLSMILFVICLISCSSNSVLDSEQQPFIITSLPPTVFQTMPVETDIPTKPSLSVNDFPDKYSLPKWINDPKNTVGLTILDIKEDIFTFGFISLGTKESFEISASSNKFMGYFWLPDGTHFGFLSIDMQTMFLVSLENGQTEKVPVDGNAAHLLKNIEREKFIEPLIVQGVYPTSFTFLPLYHQSYSSDLLYIANYDFSFENVENLPIIVENVETKEVTQITNPSDRLCNTGYMWSPVKSELAILRNTFLDGCGRIGGPPAEIIDIYKPDGSKIVSFEGSFEDATWSPDGSKILYGDEAGNSPCIFDINLAIKRCLREITRKHPNTNTTYELDWSVDGTQIYYKYISANESNLCIYNLITGSDFCPTKGLQELSFDIVRYTVSLDEHFLMFHFGGSCSTCDYWENPTVAVVDKDGRNFYFLGEEKLVGVAMYGGYTMFSYPMITMLWRPK